MQLLSLVVFLVAFLLYGNFFPINEEIILFFSLSFMFFTIYTRLSPLFAEHLHSLSAELTQAFQSSLQRELVLKQRTLLALQSQLHLPESLQLYANWVLARLELSLQLAQDSAKTEFSNAFGLRLNQEQALRFGTYQLLGEVLSALWVFRFDSEIAAAVVGDSYSPVVDYLQGRSLPAHCLQELLEAWEEGKTSLQFA